MIKKYNTHDLVLILTSSTLPLVSVGQFTKNNLLELYTEYLATDVAQFQLRVINLVKLRRENIYLNYIYTNKHSF